jgi:hypothetical protein
MNAKTPLKVHLVLHRDNQGWIIEKMARRLMEAADPAELEMSWSELQRADVDVNHWMSYAFANEPQLTRATMFITHVDDPYKASLIRNELASGVDLGICMSSSTVAELAERGIPRNSLCFVLPAHDARVVPRRIRIGLTTRTYSDGRKREWMLQRLAADMRLDAFEFEIFGAGWKHVIAELEAAGASVTYHPGTADYQADYAQILAAVPTFDYYLYLGMDEGSLGTIDAVAAGVRTIVTAQGFHLDMRPALTHLFVTYEELTVIFGGIAAERAARLDMGENLTWKVFARRHAEIWRHVASGNPGAVAMLASQRLATTPAELARMRTSPYLTRLLQPRRILSALSHWGPLKPVRAWVRRRAQARASQP